MKNLLQRARAGDAEAFSQLFQESAPRLWKAGMSVMRNEDMVADVLQETAVKAWINVPSFNGKSTFTTWVMRIMLNTCFDEMRAQKKVIPFAEIAEDGIPVQTAPESGIDAATRIDMNDALQTLGIDDRLILTLFYVNDLPVKEVAEILGITVGTARTRLSRARIRFKDAYVKDAETDELRYGEDPAGNPSTPHAANDGSHAPPLCAAHESERTPFMQLQPTTHAL